MHLEVMVLNPEKKSVSITLDTAVADKLRELSKQDHRSLSSYINLVLKEHLKSQDLR